MHKFSKKWGIGALLAFLMLGMSALSARATEPTGLDIRGRVANGENVALAGVTMVLDNNLGTATTTSEGLYAFENLTAGVHYVTPSKDGYSFDPKIGRVELPTTGKEHSPDAQYNFTGRRTTPLSYLVKGRVLNNGGTGIAGVTLGLYVSSTSTPRTTTTDNDGRYQFGEVAAGTYYVIPSKDGFTFDPANRPVTVPTSGVDGAPNGRADFVGTNTTVRYVINGRVVNRSGTAVPDVQIFGSTAFTTPLATTNSEGRFQLTNLARGTYNLIPRKEGYSFDPQYLSIVLPATSGDGAPNGKALFTATRTTPLTYSITGKIVNGNGTALPDVAVQIAGNSATTSVSTNSEGRYTLTGLAAATYTVTPSKDSYNFDPASRSVVLPTTAGDGTPNGSANFVGRKPAPVDYFIGGKVTNSSTVGIAGVTIRLSETVSTTTDAQGYYKIEHLAAGTYTVTPSKTNFTFDPASRSVTLPTTAGDAAPNGLASFVGTEKSTTTTYFIGGKVVTSAGVAIAGVAVSDGLTTVQSSSDGYYKFEGLAAGSYTLSATKEGYSLSPATPTLATSSPVVVLPKTSGDGAPNAYLWFVGASTTPQTYSIYETVHLSASASGTPAPLAGVTFTLGDSTTARATTNANGASVISGLAAGTYLLTPHKDGYSFSPASRSVTLPATGTTNPNAVVTEFIAAPNATN